MEFLTEHHLSGIINKTKQITDVAKFKAVTKSKLLSLKDEVRFSDIRYLYFYTPILYAN